MKADDQRVLITEAASGAGRALSSELARREVHGTVNDQVCRDGSTKARFTANKRSHRLRRVMRARQDGTAGLTVRRAGTPFQEK